MSLRAEMRRQQRAIDKEASRKVFGVGTVADLAARNGLTVSDLMEWKDRERKRILSEVEAGVKKTYMEQYQAITKEYNDMLQLNANDLYESYDKELQREKSEMYDRYRRQLDRAREQIKEELFGDEALKKRYAKMESMATLENVLICLVAVHKAFGYTKSLRKILECWEAATEYVEDCGTRAVFDELNEKYKLDLMFNDFDILQTLFGEAGGKCGKAKADIQSEGADGHPDA